MKPLAVPGIGKSVQETVIEVGVKYGFTYIEMLSQRRPVSLARAPRSLLALHERNRL